MWIKKKEKEISISSCYCIIELVLAVLQDWWATLQCRGVSIINQILYCDLVITGFTKWTWRIMYSIISCWQNMKSKYLMPLFLFFPVFVWKPAGFSSHYWSGSAAANAISQYLLAFLLYLYIRWRGLHKATWGGQLSPESYLNHNSNLFFIFYFFIFLSCSSL